MKPEKFHRDCLRYELLNFPNIDQTVPGEKDKLRSRRSTGIFFSPSVSDSFDSLKKPRVVYSLLASGVQRARMPRTRNTLEYAD